MANETRTIQLRRYEVIPGELPAFVDWWLNGVRHVRLAAGFTVDFAYVDWEANEFTCAVSVPGDEAAFFEVEQIYLESDLHHTVFHDAPKRVAVAHLAFVESLPTTL